MIHDMVHLIAICHRSRLLASQRPRRRMALMTSQRRPFFSFLLGDKSNNNLLAAETEKTTTTTKSKQQELERILLDGVRHRISIQNAHPLGPWQAISTVVQDHYNGWVKKVQAEAINNKGTRENTNTTKVTMMTREQEELEIASTIILPTTTATTVVPFRVLDLACGPRGEPGTTIAHALPLAAVHCTDSCSVAVAAIPVHKNHVDDDEAIDEDDSTTQDVVMPFVVPITPPPKNLTKSITDLTDLSSYSSNSFDAIVCCYGYNLSSNIPHALSEAYRVLVPGGVLVIATWERSAMLAIGCDVQAYVENGGHDRYAVFDDLPPRKVPQIKLSEVGELEGLLVASGFDQPQAVVATSLVYPIDLGDTPADQFAMGTCLIRDELESLGALGCPAGNGAGGWNLAEEGFWVNVTKYADVVEDNLLLRDNTFKLTVSTKK